MVTSFYIMKMSKNKVGYMNEYYSNLQNKPFIENYNSKSRCRVCLQDGDVSIFKIENPHGAIEALKTFGSIDVSEHDKYSKYLCNLCYKFLKSAVLFRKIALQTEETLKRIEKSPEKCKEDNSLDEFEKRNPNTDDEISLDKSDGSLPEDVKVQCDTCKKTIKKSYYKIHMTMHDPNHQNKYVCDICGKSFRLRVGCYKHMLRHRTDFAYKCKLCPFKGQYAERLKSHMRTHSKDYRYMCSECPARFLFKGNLNSHILLKHKEPQFICDSCGKAFHTKLKLQRHYDVYHLGVKKHICIICGRAFGYRNAMMKHQRQVHKREKLRFSFNSSESSN